MNTGLKVAFIVLGVCALLAITCVGGFLALSIWVVSKDPPEGIVLDVTMPDQIVVGDTFDLVLTITNEMNRPRNLLDVDFYGTLLDGVTVVSVDPGYNSFDELFMTTYTFNQTIPANGMLVITFTLTPVTPGSYAGDLDFSVDELFSFLSTQQNFVIEERP